MSKYALAPRDLFEKMLEYMPIPTFDLVIEYGDDGVIVCKRKISPYNNVWALPGLRMYKGESVDDTLVRIAKQEVGLDINPKSKKLIDQYVGKFSTENNRQDISTGYAISVTNKQTIHINPDHFSNFKIVKEIPNPVGAMYKHYLSKFFEK